MELKVGIPKLEKALGGGFNYNDVVAITGPTGVGKSTLAMQLLINGIKTGDRGMYIIMEFDKAYFYKTFENYIWNIQDYEELGTLFIVDYPPTEISHFIGQGNPLKEIIRKYDIKRVVIDSILPIALSATNEREMRLNLITAVDKIKDWGVLTFIIGESPWSKNSEFPSSYSKIESYVDGWIAMNYNINEEWERQLLVIKSRKKHEIKPIKFSIDKTGIVFE